MDKVDPIWLENSYEDPLKNKIMHVVVWHEINASEWDYDDICAQLKGKTSEPPDGEGLSFFDANLKLAVMSFNKAEDAFKARDTITPNQGTISPLNTLPIRSINTNLMNRAYIPLFAGTMDDLKSLFPRAKHINLNEQTHAAIISFWTTAALDAAIACKHTFDGQTLELSDSYLNHSRTKLWMGGVPAEFRNSTLKDYLTKHGYKCASVEILRDRQKRTSKGCATINFATVEDRTYLLMNPLANPAGCRMPIQPVKKKPMGTKRRFNDPN